MVRGNVSTEYVVSIHHVIAELALLLGMERRYQIQEVHLRPGERAHSFKKTDELDSVTMGMRANMLAKSATRRGAHRKSASGMRPNLHSNSSKETVFFRGGGSGAFQYATECDETPIGRGH